MHARLAAPVVLVTTALALGACQQLSNLAGRGTVAGKITGGVGPSVGATATTQRTDADMSQVIAALAALGAQPTETLSVARARSQPMPADAVRRVLGERGQPNAPRPVAQVRDISSGRCGPDPGACLRAGTRLGAGAAHRLLARRRLGDRRPRHLRRRGRALQAETGAVVLSVHYRQAPEHKFLAAHEDAVAAYRWAVSNARSLGADPSRVAVAGESAGGNLALNVAIAARDMRLPMPRHMALIYPVAGTDTNTPSCSENTATAPLSRAGMLWFVDKVTRSQADLQDPRLDVLGKARLEGLPPATIVSAELDPLRSEGEALARQLRDAGVPVERRNYDGVTHEFFGMAPAVADAQAAQDFVGDRLRAALGGGSRVAAR
jgi:acetyl esterase